MKGALTSSGQCTLELCRFLIGPRLGDLCCIALERRFRPRLLCDFRDPRCAPCGAVCAAPMGRAASLGAAGGARGTPGSAALRHLGARGYLRHWNGDSGRGYYATSAIRGARRADDCVPRRWAGRRALGRPAGSAARPAALHSGTYVSGAQDVCTTRAAMLDLVHGWVLYGSSFRWS